jgi:hypothetical protein
MESLKKLCQYKPKRRQKMEGTVLILYPVSLGVKRLRREADHSPPSSAQIKGCVELYIHSPNTSSWRGAQLNKDIETTLLLKTFLMVSLSPSKRIVGSYFTLITASIRIKCLLTICIIIIIIIILSPDRCNVI